MNPYLVEGPAVISFSGGRTSGYMLRRILDTGISPDVHVLFADTGKERQETYDFVRACAANWGVEIHWVSRKTEAPTPFEGLIRERGYLPTPVMRYCTQELKIRPMRDWMLAHGYEHWTNVIGLRADEPRRVARMRQPNRDRWDVQLPLADSGVKESNVLRFWKYQPFDLRLRTYEGNCDLCFLKSQAKKIRIIRESPTRADWWIEMEKVTGQPFRKDAPDYKRLRYLSEQPRLFDDCDLDDLGDCICTD